MADWVKAFDWKKAFAWVQSIKVKELEAQIDELKRDVSASQSYLKEVGGMFRDAERDATAWLDIAKTRQERVRSLESAYFDLQSITNTLQKEKQTDLALLKTCEDQVGQLKADKELSFLVPLPTLIRNLGPGQIAELNAADRGRLWWEVEKAIFKVFAKPSIEPYEEWTATQVGEQIHQAYPNLALDMRDKYYRVTTRANVAYIVLNGYVRWMEYLAEWRDCDEFALELLIYLSRYTINSGFLVYGPSPRGPHAFNLGVCTDGLLMVEPQFDFVNTVPAPPGLVGYVPEKFVI